MKIIPESLVYNKNEVKDEFKNILLGNYERYFDSINKVDAGYPHCLWKDSAGDYYIVDLDYDPHNDSILSEGSDYTEYLQAQNELKKLVCANDKSAPFWLELLILSVSLLLIIIYLYLLLAD
jgi:hypothetical protein